MRPLRPDQLEAEALEAFFHHGANVARIAGRLRGVVMANGNRWPSPADGQARTAAEGDPDPAVRRSSSADPAAAHKAT